MDSLAMSSEASLASAEVSAEVGAKADQKEKWYLRNR
jgi:hypothetical protein